MNKPTEQYGDWVKGYEGLYSIVEEKDEVWSHYKGKHKRKKPKLIGGTTKKEEYRRFTLSKDGKSKTLQLHVIKAMTYLDFVPCGWDLVVDHIDHDPTNNALSNLQIITNRDNITKGYKRKETSSEYTGVNWHKASQKWVTQIHFDGKNYHLGLFSSEEEAYEAYQKARERVDKGLPPK